MLFRTIAKLIPLAGLISATLFVPFTEAEDVPPVPRAYQSFAPLIERTAPSVVNIYSRKIIRSRSATRYLDGVASSRNCRSALREIR
jgi:S1-C subfamily serine protease